jgi:hypothetical protein
MCDTWFPKHFQAPNNIIKYDEKTNPSVWLEDYRLAYKVGGADDELFIIQFLPIYLADSARAWLDHLPRNVIDCWSISWRSSRVVSWARLCDPTTTRT